MGKGRAVVVFILFLIVVIWASTGFSTSGLGIPSTGADPLAFLAPNPNSLDAAAAQRRAEAQALEQQAQQQRDWANQQTASVAQELARETRIAGDAYAQQTAVVQASQTAQIQQVTVVAAQTMDAVTLEAIHANATGTQIVVNNKATADALTLADISAGQTATAQVRKIDLQNKQTGADVGYQLRYLPTIAILIVSLAIGTGAAYSLIAWTRRRNAVNMKTVPVGPDGTHEAVVMGGKIHNVDQFPQPTIDPAMPVLAATVDNGLEVARLHQGVRGINGLSRGGFRGQAYQAADRLTQRVSIPAVARQSDQTQDDAQVPDDVPWSVMQRWPGKKWALGLGAGGNMISLDPDDDSAPHLLGAGTTGTGKSHGLLHPVILQALATNRFVVGLDRTGGLGMFNGHSNFRDILIDDPAQAIDYLDAAYKEVIRRQRLMAPTGCWKWSMWKDAPDPAMLIVMDEFSDLADELETDKDRERLWRSARMVAAEGRKAGVLLAIALQDPTHRSIDLRIRRNCTPVAFRVQDSSASMVILRVPGAENLADRHFMTRMNGQVLEGVAFDVTAQDVQQFLAAHPVPQLPAPKWLELGESVSIPVKPEPKVDDTEAREQRIRAMHAAGKSMNEIEFVIFGYTGGKAYAEVKAALGDTTDAGTTDSASTGPEMAPA